MTFNAFQQETIPTSERQVVDLNGAILARAYRTACQQGEWDYGTKNEDIEFRMSLLLDWPMAVIAEFLGKL